MLFESEPRFRGLPEGGFDLFELPDREVRRREIVRQIHPSLAALGEDLVARLDHDPPLHVHLPRLDWPREYQPFCTWMALSTEAQGYQSRAQLNVGVHADFTAARLGWDTAADAFGRFEFLCLLGGLGRNLVDLARDKSLVFRVYAAAAWPVGSRCVFESPDDLRGSFAEVERRGVWWELGRRFELPAERPLVCSPDFGLEVATVFEALLPVYTRVAGESREN